MSAPPSLDQPGSSDFAATLKSERIQAKSKLPPGWTHHEEDDSYRITYRLTGEEDDGRGLVEKQIRSRAGLGIKLEGHSRSELFYEVILRPPAEGWSPDRLAQLAEIHRTLTEPIYRFRPAGGRR